MASAVTIDPESLEVYEEIKSKLIWRYVIYRLSDDCRRIIVDEKGPRDKDFSDFLKSLERAESLRQCRFAVYDFEYQVDGDVREKLVFVSWIPDNIGMMQKMSYASSHDELIKKLDVRTEIQVTSLADLDYAAMVKKCEEYK